MKVLIDGNAAALAAVPQRVWPWFALQIPGGSASKLARTELLVNGILYVEVVGTLLGYGVCLSKDLRRAMGKPPFTKKL